MSEEPDRISEKLEKLGKHFRLSLKNFPPDTSATRRLVHEAALNSYEEERAERRKSIEELRKKHPELTIFKKKNPKKPNAKPK
jgi:hypothetical protein